MAESNKDRLQTTTPVLRDLVVRTANSHRRNFPTDVNTVDMGIFSEEAEKLRELASKSGTFASFTALVEHATGKLRLTPIRSQNDSRLALELNIKINIFAMTRQRRERQDRSIGLIVSTTKNDFDNLPLVANLLIEEREPLSPAGVMLVAEDGVHLFFRSQNTPEETTEQNNKLISQLQGRTSVTDFARWNQLRHFYCPKGQITATPVLM